MEQIKVLNLYAGIGGNRKLWENVQVTAIEMDESIAGVYQGHFPDDTVIINDAHKYLLQHYKDGWDFIWASPPCPSHSRARFWNRKLNPVYPEMALYEEIIFLKHFFDGLWVVENVVPFYQPLIESQKINRHLFWSNFTIKPFNEKSLMPTEGSIQQWQKVTGFNLDGVKLNQRKDKVLRNCVLPELGKHILDCAMGYQIKEEQKELFA